MFDPPIFINVRDRVTTLRALVEWLERAGHERITLLDNASTYEPLVEYLKTTPHDVYCLDENLGSRAIWIADLAPRGWYVYTDPDVVPTEDCPLDAVEHLHELLVAHPEWVKAGLGLYLDDVPETLRSYQWERSLVATGRELTPGAYASMVDTTFALYGPDARDHTLHAIRTGAPYQCRHIPWYHIDEPDDEERYYLDHAIRGPMGSSWADGKQ